MTSSYSEKVIFMDDTTDDGGFGLDQGKVRVAKLFVGDLDNDEIGDIWIDNFSLDAETDLVARLRLLMMKFNLADPRKFT